MRKENTMHPFVQGSLIVICNLVTAGALLLAYERSRRLGMLDRNRITKRLQAWVDVVAGPEPVITAPRKHPRVLVADDNVESQQIALLQLQQLGFHVDVVGDGQEAIDSLKTTAYDLVLMDCQMPGMNGYDASSAIRGAGRPGARDVPIIAVTASQGAGERDRCLQAGMNDFVQKPFAKGDLKAVIDKWTAADALDTEDPREV